jgi:hypothetical protein
MPRAVPMKNLRPSPGRARRAPWLAGLALCVRATTPFAQERPWSTTDDVYEVSVRRPCPTDAHDPDLVRAGERPTLADALAHGVTVERHGAADFDGDGRVDLTLVVTPRRDPYPFNHSPGLVLALARAGGWSAVVVARRCQRERDPDPWSGRYAWAPAVVGSRAALLALDDQTLESRDGAYYEHQVTFLRVDRAGRLWLVGATSRTEGHMPHGQCHALRYRFVGPWAVRGNARECRTIHLEARGR